MSDSSNITNETSINFTSLGFSYPVRIWLYLVPNVLSILCSMLVLYHFLFDRKLRQALNNHVIIVLILIGLICELTDIFWIIHYYYFQFTLFPTSSFSLAWSFIDFACPVIQTMLFAWATIERHILIFYSNWVSTTKKRILVHYLPIITIIVYPTIWYIFVFFGTNCINTFDYTLIFGVASPPCIFNISVVAMWDWLVNQIIPTFTIIFFSLALLVRVISQKRRLHQSINWKKQKKMFIQLISISLIYFIFNVPYTLLNLAYSSGLSREVVPEFAFYTWFFLYYVIFLLPFVAYGTVPDLKLKLKKLCCHRRQQRLVHPTIQQNLTMKKHILSVEQQCHV